MSRFDTLNETEIPDYADVFTIEEFVNDCKTNNFTNDDGSGYYANPPTMFYFHPAIPSELAKGRVTSGFSHVAWFNK